VKLSLDSLSLISELGSFAFRRDLDNFNRTSQFVNHFFSFFFFKDQLLSDASLRSLQATGMSIQPLAETQGDFFFFSQLS
ncbi:MAG: hypothetical protein Q4Q42_07560, partial [Planctomycetia bacterium]|nr:hypothetical protein [Planctomycetia bacterium]